MPSASSAHRSRLVFVLLLCALIFAQLPVRIVAEDAGWPASGVAESIDIDAAVAAGAGPAVGPALTFTGRAHPTLAFLRDSHPSDHFSVLRI